MFFAEGFDRNFSLQATPDGPDKIVYDGLRYPFRLRPRMTRNWTTGSLHMNIEIGSTYRLVSTDDPRSYIEEGFHSSLDSRLWQSVGRFQFGFNFHFKHKDRSVDSAFTLIVSSKSTDIIEEPVFAYVLNEHWKPLLYLSYNYKSASEIFDIDSYRRDIYAYLIELEFKPGGNFIWHFANQRQFYYRNDDTRFQEMRYNIGIEYRFKNIWFYLVEAMEGDFPTPKYMHNHTYVQMMLVF
jgi:hypothetical protein